ncbi:hypothetical protein ACKKBF_B04805 [Auxenochlorella protothecoides x Auxenochlorella symbiontica]
MQRLVALLVGALFELSQVSGSYVNREHFAPSTESVLMQMLSLSSRGTKICPQPTCGVGECSWPGVSCEKGKVVQLTLPGAGLRMQFPSNMFSLSELRVLDLRNNELVGPLPAAMPLQLTTINLAHNDLSGTIPQSWASLPHLQRVWLQGNRIDGPLPAGWQEDCGALAVDGPTLPEAPSLVLVCVSTVQHQKDSSEREDALASVLTTPAAPAAAHGEASRGTLHGSRDNVRPTKPQDMPAVTGLRPRGSIVPLNPRGYCGVPRESGAHVISTSRPCCSPPCRVKRRCALPGHPPAAGCHCDGCGPVHLLQKTACSARRTSTAWCGGPAGWSCGTPPQETRRRKCDAGRLHINQRSNHSHHAE